MNITQKISIITPSFNQGHFIEETIQSVLLQNYPALEFIIIDGGSSDDSISIIKKYEQNISYWVSEKDSGQSNAINKGLRLASGDIITWINSDDLLLPGALNKVAEYFASVPENIGVIHGGTILFEDGKDLRKVHTYGVPSVEKYLSGMAFSQPSAFFRRSYLEQVGLLQESLHYGMDYDLFARLSCVCQFHQVKTLFSKYRLHNESKSVIHSKMFRDDWNRVFISICKHLGWERINQEAAFYVSDLEFCKPLLQYDFTVTKENLEKVNKQKVLFYFLCDLLLHYYWYDDINTSRVLYFKMRRNFPMQWFHEDIRVSTLIGKLLLPDELLFFFKKVKRFFY